MYKKVGIERVWIWNIYVYLEYGLSLTIYVILGYTQCLWTSIQWYGCQWCCLPSVSIFSHCRHLVELHFLTPFLWVWLCMWLVKDNGLWVICYFHVRTYGCWFESLQGTLPLRHTERQFFIWWILINLGLQVIPIRNAQTPNIHHPVMDMHLPWIYSTSEE